MILNENRNIITDADKCSVYKRMLMDYPLIKQEQMFCIR